MVGPAGRPGRPRRSAGPTAGTSPPRPSPETRQSTTSSPPGAAPPAAACVVPGSGIGSLIAVPPAGISHFPAPRCSAGVAHAEVAVADQDRVDDQRVAPELVAELEPRRAAAAPQPDPLADRLPGEPPRRREERQRRIPRLPAPPGKPVAQVPVMTSPPRAARPPRAGPPLRAVRRDPRLRRVGRQDFGRTRVQQGPLLRRERASAPGSAASIALSTRRSSRRPLAVMARICRRRSRSSGSLLISPARCSPSTKATMSPPSMPSRRAMSFWHARPNSSRQHKIACWCWLSPTAASCPAQCCRASPASLINTKLVRFRNAAGSSRPSEVSTASA